MKVSKPFSMDLYIQSAAMNVHEDTNKKEKKVREGVCIIIIIFPHRVPYNYILHY